MTEVTCHHQALFRFGRHRSFAKHLAVEGFFHLFLGAEQLGVDDFVDDPALFRVDL